MPHTQTQTSTPLPGISRLMFYSTFSFRMHPPECVYPAVCLILFSPGFQIA